MNRKINRTHEVWLSTKLKVLTMNRKDKSDALLARHIIAEQNVLTMNRKDKSDALLARHIIAKQNVLTMNRKDKSDDLIC